MLGRLVREGVRALSRGEGASQPTVEGRRASSAHRPCCNLVDMATKLENVTAQAMSLPTESRARLADRLVESLDADELGGLDRLWIAEAKRRRDELRTGSVKPIRGDVALRRVRDAARR